MLELLAMTGKKYDPDPTDVQGQVFFTATTGTDWTVPAGVYAISAVCIGGGQPSGSGNINGRDGGDLRWRNKIPVTPGEVLRIRASVATNYLTFAGQASNIVRKESGEILLQAGGGGNTQELSTPLGDGVGGGNGGKGNMRGGGGAGGYSGNGGNGSSNEQGYPGTGGAGGGGCYYVYNGNTYGGGGGGTGVHGEGPNGIGGTGGSTPSSSGGGSGSWFSTTPSAQKPLNANGPNGGDFGGGAGGSSGYNGTRGAVRIIWGKGREFPSTGTKDV